MKASVFVAIGILAALMIGCVPSQAASAGIVEVTSLAGDPDFCFDVENVGYFALDADYLNFSVMSHPTTYKAGTNGTYYVHVSINDGVTNYTWNKTLAVSNMYHVYSNVSMATPVTSGPFVANATATLGVALYHVTGGDCKIENYTAAEIAIFDSSIGGAVLNLVPMIVMIALLGIMLPMIAKFGKRK